MERPSLGLAGSHNTTRDLSLHQGTQLLLLPFIVHALPYTEFKHALSHNFRAFNHVCKGPWLIFGDYNEITNDSKKFGGKSKSEKNA